jgi:hypothetical protein
MKIKKFSKKLNINKSTIANLSQDNQDEVRGGVKPTGFTICTCPYTQCPYTDCGDSIHSPCYC